MKRECMKIYEGMGILRMSNEDCAKDNRLCGCLQLEGRWPDH
jgi:hypothetical protein